MVLATLVWSATAAHAEPPPPSDLRYREGKQAFASGDYAGAAARFEEAFRLSDDPVYLFNLAQAQRLAGDCAAARRSYRAFLVRVPDASNRADVEEKIASLESCAAPRPPPAPIVVSAPPAAIERDEAPPASHGYGGLWVAGGGAVSLAVGFFAWRSAVDKQDQLCTLTETGACDGRFPPEQLAEADEIKSQMRSRELIAYAAVPLGVGLVAGGLIYHLVQVRKARRARSRTTVQVGAAPLPGGGGIVLFGRSDL